MISDSEIKEYLKENKDICDFVNQNEFIGIDIAFDGKLDYLFLDENGKNIVYNGVEKGSLLSKALVSKEIALKLSKENKIKIKL